MGMKKEGGGEGFQQNGKWWRDCDKKENKM
jgi:hypothetical protein